MVTFICITVALLAIDLITKSVFYGGSDHNIIPGLIGIQPAAKLNEGAAWGMFSNATLFLTIFTAVIIIAGIVLYIRHKKKSHMLNISMGIVAGGAIGNLVDRIFLGGVRDFIAFEFMDFPIFNFADVCLNVGFALLAVYFVIRIIQDAKQEKELKKVLESNDLSAEVDGGKDKG
jgi:signal peptidase II